MVGAECVGQCLTRIGTGVGEEHQHAELVQCGADVVGKGPYDRPTAHETAENEPDEERSTRTSEREVSASGQGKDDQAQQKSECEAETETDRIEISRSSLGVAEKFRDLVHGRSRCHHADAVARGEHKVICCQEIDVAAAHSRGGGSVAAGEA